MPVEIQMPCETPMHSVLATKLALATNELLEAFNNAPPEDSLCKRKIFQAAKDIRKAAKATRVFDQFNDLSTCFFSQFEYKYIQYWNFQRREEKANKKANNKANNKAKKKAKKKVKASILGRIEEMQVV